MAEYVNPAVRQAQSPLHRMDAARVEVLRNVARYQVTPAGYEHAATRYIVEQDMVEAVAHVANRPLYELTDLGRQVLELCAAGPRVIEHSGMVAVRDERDRRVLRHVLRVVQNEVEAA